MIFPIRYSPEAQRGHGLIANGFSRGKQGGHLFPDLLRHDDGFSRGKQGGHTFPDLLRHDE
jgi:hypothetical protein